MYEKKIPLMRKQIETTRYEIWQNFRYFHVYTYELAPHHQARHGETEEIEENGEGDEEKQQK